MLWHNAAPSRQAPRYRLSRDMYERELPLIRGNPSGVSVAPKKSREFLSKVKS